MQTHFLLLFFLVSCSNPFEGRGKLVFRDIQQETILENQFKEELAFAKKREWETIVREAKESFDDIRPLLVKKCFDCHDANTKLPLYARVFPNINPLTKHQADGLKALDFSEKFPLKAQGNPSQLSLLNAFRSSVQDKTMPIASYTAVYRSSKITPEDQELIFAWIDPLVEKIQSYHERYSDNVLTGPQILEQKCFRCHANGVKKGGFGEMENTEKLFKGKFVDLEDPSQSILYTISHDGEMPPNPREALTQEELIIFREWLEQEAPKYKPKP